MRKSHKEALLLYGFLCLPCEFVGVERGGICHDALDPARAYLYYAVCHFAYLGVLRRYYHGGRLVADYLLYHVKQLDLAFGGECGGRLVKNQDFCRIRKRLPFNERRTLESINVKNACRKIQAFLNGIF